MSEAAHTAAQQNKGPRSLVLLGVAATFALAVALYAGLKFATSDRPALQANEALPAEQGPRTNEGATLEHMARTAALPVTITRLEERLAKQPQDLEGVTLLARSYVQTGHLPEGIKAFRQALALAPRNADLMIELADALAFANQQRFDGEPQALIERALAAEPSHPGALSLAGLAAFDRADYQQAARHWRHYLEVTPPSAHAQVKQGLAAALERLQKSTPQEST